MSDANGGQHPQPPAYQPPAPPAGQSVPLAPLNHGVPPSPVPGYAPAPAYQAQAPAYQAQAPAYPPAAQAYPPVAPGYPAPGQPPAHAAAFPVAHAGYPVPAYQQPYGLLPPSGRRFWAIQFLQYVPYVGWIVVAIVALVQRASARRSPFPIVRENARWAANWALSFALYTFVLIALMIILLMVHEGYAARGDYSNYASPPAALLVFIPLLAIGVYCLVTMIRGCIVADRAVHRPALALPFFRQ